MLMGLFPRDAEFVGVDVLWAHPINWIALEGRQALF